MFQSQVLISLSTQPNSNNLFIRQKKEKKMYKMSSIMKKLDMQISQFHWHVYFGQSREGLHIQRLEESHAHMGPIWAVWYGHGQKWKCPEIGFLERHE